MGVLLLAGTTASGKSSLAVELAERYNAVILSADAMTVYRGLDVGTAKPSLEERRQVRHLGIDIRDINEPFDVSDFTSLVKTTRETHPRVIIAGGTTFWLSALVRPLARLPAADLDLRATLEALDDPHRDLAAVDAEAAARLHPNDRVRVIRALEVYHLTGETQTSLHAKGPRTPALDTEIIWLDREDLRSRIHDRLQCMRDQGYVDETETALTRDPSAQSKPLQSFAYRHIIDHIRGDLDLDEALRRTERDTWHYARKQRTWARGLGWSLTDQTQVDRKAKSAFERRT